jgi:uncharacterized damage-inducible protein DinB
VDEYLIRHAPAPPIPLAPQIKTARAALETAARTLAGIDDAALDKTWPYREGEADLRYGFYRLYERLEEARGEAERRLEAAAISRTAAQPRVGAATAARWDLHGILAFLADEDLDRDPGRGDWTLRQTLAHIAHSQRAYTWFTAWWFERRNAPADDYPAAVPDDAIPEWTDDEAAEGRGSLAEIRERLDSTLDDGAAVFGSLDEDALAARARWSGAAVDVGFRLGRWASHIREHTVQVEKTLAALADSPSEVERLLRLVYGAYGRFEAVAFGRPADEIAPAADLFPRFAEETRGWTNRVAEGARAA